MNVKEKFADWPGKNRLSIRDSARFAAILAAIGCLWSFLAYRYGLTWYVVGPYILEPGRYLTASWLPEPFNALPAFSALSATTILAVVYGAAARLVCAGYFPGLTDKSRLEALRIRHPFQGLLIGWIAGVFAQIAGCIWYGVGAVDAVGDNEGWKFFSIAVGTLIFVASEHALRNAVDFHDPIDFWPVPAEKSAGGAGEEGKTPGSTP